MLAVAKRLLALLCIAASAPPVSAEGYEDACAKLVARQRLQIARLRAELRDLRSDRVAGLRRSTTIVRSDPCDGEFDLASNEDVQLLANEGCSHVKEIMIHEEVSSLAGLESITSAGRLLIDNTDLSSLSGLENLVDVSGELLITGNDDLTSLSGLVGLQSASKFVIENNNGLDSLDGLSNLISVRDVLQIFENDGLQSLTALRGLRSVGSLVLGSNPELTSLEGLEGLTSLGDLTLSGTDLQSLSGLGNLHTVTGKVRIDGNSRLITLEGLEGLERAGQLHLVENYALRRLRGLQNLATVRSEGSSSVRDEILIHHHPNLKSLRGLEGLRSALVITIRENGIRTLAGLDNLVTADAISITQNPQLHSLSGLESLQSVETFLLNANFELNSMQGLRSLVRVPTELHISQSRNLQSLAGLENLSSVGVFRLTHNRRMISLVGLKSLSHAWGGIVIQGCESLRSLLGLASLMRTAQLSVKGTGPLQMLGGPFAQGAKVGKIEFDRASWPTCVTPHERLAVVSAVEFVEDSTIPDATWHRWHNHDCGWELFTCTKGLACSFTLANFTSSGMAVVVPIERVFISEPHGGCGGCPDHRPQSDIGDGGLVDLGYALALEEARPYSICRCNSGVGPLGQLLLRGPRLSAQATVCTRGFNCTVKVDGEALEATDEVVLASDCSASPPVGFEAIMVGENEYLLHGSAWYAATPTRYEVCWRAPCRPAIGTAACDHTHGYFKAGDVELHGVYVRDDMQLVLGQVLTVPNVGFGVSDTYDRMRLGRSCGEADNNNKFAIEANSSGMQFDFGALTHAKARAGRYRFCWCRVRDGIWCDTDGQFLADSGSVELQCSKGWQLAVGGRCERCPPGRQQPTPGLEPCEECPIGRFSMGGAVDCEICRGETFAELPGSSTCDPCLIWQFTAADGASCRTDPANLVLGAAFLFCVGAACAIVVHHWNWQRQVVDVSLLDGQTIVTIFKSHGLGNKRGRSFPVTFYNTGCPGLDSPSEPFRARVKDAARLELRTSSGEKIKERLDTSMGTLLVPLASDAFHTGRPVPFAFSALVLSGTAVALVPALATTDMSPVAFLGGPLIAMLSTLTSWAVRLQRQRETPLTKRLAKFKAQLGHAHSLYCCEKGPDRAISIGKLHELLDFFREYIRDRTAYYLTECILKPLTKDEGLSYAELAGAEEVEWFVSHFWGTAFEHFCTALRRHAESACGEARKWNSVRYWVCFCSNNQHQLKGELGESWKESSFYLTLQSGLCRGTCMVLDDQALPLTRIWCIFELLQTIRLERSDDQFQGLLLCTSGGVLNSGRGSVDVAMALAKKVAEMDLATARASKASDEEMIRSHVKEELGSFVTLNQFLRRAVRRMLVSARHNSNQQFEAVLALLDVEGDGASSEEDQGEETCLDEEAEETFADEEGEKTYVEEEGEKTHVVEEEGDQTYLGKDIDKIFCV